VNSEFLKGPNTLQLFELDLNAQSLFQGYTICGLI